MKAFFSDLDNTLIYSHRRQLPAEKIAVEELDGKDQSYMTRYAWSFLREARWLHLVPVTTRTQEQYGRLRFPREMGVRYALVCGGGKLLVDGEEDGEWTRETESLARGGMAEFADAARLFREICGGSKCPEPYYHYAVPASPGEAYGEVTRRIKGAGVLTARDGRKLYLFARSVNKGLAVKRFAERFGAARCAAAGDGMLDVSMLGCVDHAIGPEEALEGLTGPCVHALKGGILSDGICDVLRELHERGEL